MPNYLLYAGYGLFVVGILACLFYVVKSFEDDDGR